MSKDRKVIRCAIYTRKSTEEGLDQAFNSLHAQREACEAYVKSQAGEGWKVLPRAYDDGGFSGGNMDRPGLVQLMADVDAGLIDIVVVYKVDRLTRSLADFAKIVERLDGAGASFVSVTQAFNTTTSMGRLTLNPAVVCAVRAGGHRRADPRQDRRLQGQGHVDGRDPAARLRPPNRSRDQGAGPQSR
jgi:DNA invertase Pin-like site-specific DNA recombinase